MSMNAISIRLKNTGVKFTQIPNSIIQCPMSMKAKVTWLYLASKPDDWVFSETQLIKEGHVGSRETYRRSCNELIEKGLLTKRQLRDSKGRFTYTDYILYTNQEEKMALEGSLKANQEPTKRQLKIQQLNAQNQSLKYSIHRRRFSVPRSIYSNTNTEKTYLTYSSLSTEQCIENREDSQIQSQPKTKTTTCMDKPTLENSSLKTSLSKVEMQTNLQTQSSSPLPQKIRDRKKGIETIYSVRCKIGDIEDKMREIERVVGLKKDCVSLENLVVYLEPFKNLANSLEESQKLLCQSLLTDIADLQATVKPLQSRLDAYLLPILEVRDRRAVERAEYEIKRLINSSQFITKNPLHLKEIVNSYCAEVVEYSLCSIICGVEKLVRSDKPDMSFNALHKTFSVIHDFYTDVHKEIGFLCKIDLSNPEPTLRVAE